MGICLPIKETWVLSLVWGDTTCHGATKPVHHSYWSLHAPEPAQSQCWARMLQGLKPAYARVCTEPVLGPNATRTEAHMPQSLCFAARKATTTRRPHTAGKSSPRAAVKTQNSQKKQFTDHLAGHALIMKLIIDWSRDCACTYHVADVALITWVIMH